MKARKRGGADYWWQPCACEEGIHSHGAPRLLLTLLWRPKVHGFLTLWIPSCSRYFFLSLWAWSHGWLASLSSLLVFPADPLREKRRRNSKLVMPPLVQETVQPALVLVRAQFENKHGTPSCAMASHQATIADSRFTRIHSRPWSPAWLDPGFRSEAPDAAQESDKRTGYPSEIRSDYMLPLFFSPVGISSA